MEIAERLRRLRWTHPIDQIAVDALAEIERLGAFEALAIALQREVDANKKEIQRLQNVIANNEKRLTWHDELLAAKDAEIDGLARVLRDCQSVIAGS